MARVDPIRPSVLNVERWDTYLHKYLNLGQLFLLYPVRVLVTWLRQFYYVRIRRRLVAILPPSQAIAAETVRHNLTGLRDYASTRSLGLIRPLSCLDIMAPDSRILVVGPRTESELLILVGHGFRSRCIRGLDLISYSPWVDVGDMHAMPYRDNAWDAAMLSWCILYSSRPEDVAREAVRVTRPGGVIAVGLDFDPRSDEEIRDLCGYLPGATLRLDSVSEILELFRPHVDHVYFSQDVIPARRCVPGAVLALFSIKKGAN